MIKTNVLQFDKRKLYSAHRNYWHPLNRLIKRVGGFGGWGVGIRRLVKLLHFTLKKGEKNRKIYLFGKKQTPHQKKSRLVNRVGKIQPLFKICLSV